ncbi:Ulp1-like peptidase [Cucumis melo var. makuwa]|uniref:Ulp1-like peptidase n=1 Tax=Cucumis melo var. makuwa TaxID=1194695 RepID=A0A5D3CTX6_CUCMM|nr:Ulp1-like peptidase [Cucumis melo var. makuwa]
MTSTSTDRPLYKVNPSHHFYALVWAYESIPTIIGCGVDKVNDDVIPQMLRWVCQQSLKSQTISQVFDSSMLIIKAVIEMTPKEEQLKIASGELFESLRSSTIVQLKNGGSKRGREVVNDEGDFKKSKKQKSKSKMKKVIRNLQDRVAVVEGQLTNIKPDIDELKGMMSTILKHIGLQRKGDEGDHKGFEGLVDHTLESEEVDNAKTEDVDTGGTPNWLRMPKEDDTSNGAKHIVYIELKKPIDVLEKKVEIGLEEPIDVIDDEHLDALFLFIRFKIKAAGIPSTQNFTIADTIFMRILVAKWPQYKERIKENRPFDWKEEYRLVDYVFGSKEDFQDPWTSVDYVYSPFNVHSNHWVLLCLDLVSYQVKVWDSLPSLTTAKEMRDILLSIRELVPNLLDSTRFFARRGGSSTYKEP